MAAGHGHFVTGSADGTVRIWSAEGRSVGSWRAGLDSITDLAVTANGKRMFSSSVDYNIHEWEADTDTAFTRFLTSHQAISPYQRCQYPKHEIRGAHGSWPVSSVAVVAVGHQERQGQKVRGVLVSGGDDGTIRTWGAARSRRRALVDSRRGDRDRAGQANTT